MLEFLILSKRCSFFYFLQEILRHMEFQVKGRPGSKFRKLYAYSAHDLTITTLLDTMGVYDFHQPGYASVIMIELKRNVTSGTYFIDVSTKNNWLSIKMSWFVIRIFYEFQILYRNDTTRDPYILHPPGCQRPSCEFKTFAYNHNRYLPRNWHEECKLTAWTSGFDKTFCKNVKYNFYILTKSVF